MWKRSSDTRDWTGTTRSSVGFGIDMPATVTASTEKDETLQPCLTFYTIGLQTNQVKQKKWSVKVSELTADIQSIIEKGHVNGIFLSEVGKMVNVIEEPLLCVQAFFNNILQELGLPRWKVFADTPYVALLDVSVWKVKEREQIHNLLSHTGHRAQHMLLEHAESKRIVRVFNNHSPTSIANPA